MKLSHLLPLVFGSATLLLGTLPQEAKAIDFTGKTITQTYYFPNLSTPYATGSTTVVNGSASDAMNILGSYTLNPESNYFDITFLIDSNWKPTAFSGFTLSNLISNDGQTITGATFSGTGTLVSQLTAANISTTPNSITVNWQSLNFSCRSDTRLV